MVRNRIFLSSSVILIIIVAVGIVFGSRSQIIAGLSTDRPAVTIPEWPPLSMVFETNGAVISVGQDPAVVTREVRRLDYQSKDQWKVTVIEAPTTETSLGDFSHVGSFEQLDGRVLTAFDATSNLTSQETVEEGVRQVSGSFMAPFPIQDSGIEFTTSATDARVCFRDQCSDHAVGLLYQKPSGSEMVFVDDARGIPLRVNNAFVVRELQIHSDRVSVEP